MRRHKQYHSIGDYWTMHFDASHGRCRGSAGLMRQDARVVRWTILKLGEKVEDVVAVKEKPLPARSPVV
ncbi:hypothetical protein A0H81_12910 [Grifola frondosa]|uniref:Uncharacterized protein n=1 Tax=Grifola frondosa TaxID=5627 RepID=A0A1C7LT77_GRIFR|nr:hypothetical protein A0H81_12910 [Grifola frondosa]